MTTVMSVSTWKILDKITNYKHTLLNAFSIEMYESAFGNLIESGIPVTNFDSVKISF